MELDTTEDSDTTDTDLVATTGMVLDIDTFGDARRGPLRLSPPLKLKPIPGTTMVLDIDTFGDARRGPLRLSPLLKLKPIPGTTMVLATMVVTMDVVTLAVTMDS